MLVSKIKRLKEETITLLGLKDLEDVVITTMGEDVWNAILYFKEENSIEKSALYFIEEGIFTEQIRESGLIEKLVSRIVNALGEQGYLKKNKDIKKFIPDEEELIEVIDEKLSSGIMNYFE